MTKKEVTNLTYETLNKCLSEYGYKYNKSEMQFELKKGEYAYFITFIIVDRSPQFKLSFVLDIRNEKVEDIANKFTQSSVEFQKYSSTVTVPFNYLKQKRLEFHITNQNNFEEIYNFICPFYKENIYPFLEENLTLDNLSSFVDKIIQEDNEFIPVTADMFNRNIILLKLTKNTEFEKRVNQLKERMKTYSSLNKQNFENTYEYLKTL